VFLVKFLTIEKGKCVFNQSLKLQIILQHFTARRRRKNFKVDGTIKGKFTLEQVTKVQRGSRGIAPLILNLDAKWEWVVTPLHAPGRFTLGEEKRHPLHRKLGGTHG
jgi:hypothetical protein